MRLSFQQAGLFARDLDTSQSVADEVASRAAEETNASTNRIHARSSIGIGALGGGRRADARWDAFAEQAGASFQGSATAIRLEALKSARKQRLRRFAFFDAQGAQIGQCAVLVGKPRNRILDAIQLLPHAADCWPDAMMAMLRAIGTGRYFYGGRWNKDPARTACIAALPGVCLESARPMFVQGVNFSRWPDFDSYWKKTSENVRRNARYALERNEGIHTERLGWRAVLTNLRALCSLKAASLDKKGLQEHVIHRARRLIMTALTFRDRADLQIARDGAGGILSFQLNVRFGRETYYLEGGQASGATGANWLLFREVLRDAFTRHPDGHFLMGRFEPATHDEEVGGGLYRSRRSLRVDDHEIAEVEFAYTAE